MKKSINNFLKSYLVISLLFFSFVVGSIAKAATPESKDPIKVVIMGYSGDNIIMQIYGELISKLGYNVEYTPADYIGQFAGLKSGDLHIGSPGWDTTAKDVMADAWGSGTVLNMGNIGISVFEDWWYPLYVKDKCPGLPNWEALLDAECAKSLSTAETSPKGRFLEGPIEWGGTGNLRIEALGLPLEVINAGSDAALGADIVAAVKRKEPIIAWTWQPYWLPAMYPGEFVAWPEYGDGCYDDASWGPNPNKTHDCGNPTGYMWKSAWAGGESIWPKAYDVWKKFTLDEKTMGDLVYKSDIDGTDTMDVAKGWIAENESIWSEWLK